MPFKREVVFNLGYSILNLTETHAIGKLLGHFLPQNLNVCCYRYHGNVFRRL